MNRKVGCPHIAVYAGSGSDQQPSSYAVVFAGSIKPIWVGDDQITVELCSVPPDYDGSQDAEETDYPFVEFDVTPSGARALAAALVAEADRADLSAVGGKTASA